MSTTSRCATALLLANTLSDRAPSRFTGIFAVAKIAFA